MRVFMTVLLLCQTTIAGTTTYEFEGEVFVNFRNGPANVPDYVRGTISFDDTIEPTPRGIPRTGDTGDDVVFRNAVQSVAFSISSFQWSSGVGNVHLKNDYFACSYARGDECITSNQVNDSLFAYVHGPPGTDLTFGVTGTSHEMLAATKIPDGFDADLVQSVQFSVRLWDDPEDSSASETLFLFGNNLSIVPEPCGWMLACLAIPLVMFRTRAD